MAADQPRPRDSDDAPAFVPFTADHLPPFPQATDVRSAAMLSVLGTGLNKPHPSLRLAAVLKASAAFESFAAEAGPNALPPSQVRAVNKVLRDLRRDILGYRGLHREMFAQPATRTRIAHGHEPFLIAFGAFARVLVRAIDRHRKMTLARDLAARDPDHHAARPGLKEPSSTRTGVVLDAPPPVRAASPTPSRIEDDRNLPPKVIDIAATTIERDPPSSPTRSDTPGLDTASTKKGGASPTQASTTTIDMSSRQLVAELFRRIFAHKPTLQQQLATTMREQAAATAQPTTGNAPGDDQYRPAARDTIEPAFASPIAPSQAVPKPQPRPFEVPPPAAPVSAKPPEFRIDRAPLPVQSGPVL